MRKLVCTFLTISLNSFSLNSNAQQVIASAGDYYESENISLSWTLGEPIIETIN